MNYLTGTPAWDDVWQWDTISQLKGGAPDAPLNRQAQAILNQIAALRAGRIITPLDPGVGARGDGESDDFLPLRGMINSLKRPGLDLSTPTSARAALRGLPRITIDLCGRTYRISQSLDFADSYNLQFRNGVVLADPNASWGDTPMLNVAAPQATDTVRDQHIRYVSFVDITADGNGVANIIYLANTFNVVLERFYGLGWPDGGKGLWTSSRGESPISKNTNLQITACVFMQKDSAEVVGSWVSTSGTAVSLKNADFMINGLIVAFADIGLEIDWANNAQVSNLHSYVKSDQICLSVGANASNISFSNLYMDTGLVQLRSFAHKFAAAQFIAGSVLQLIATVAGEDMAGLYIDGMFSSNPQYLTEGSGSWATNNYKGRVTGTRYDGAEILTRGKVILGAQSAGSPSLIFSDDTAVYPKTGFYSPAPNAIRYSANGSDAFGWDSSGRLLYGYDTSIPCAQGTVPKIQMHDTGGGASSASLTRWSSTASFGGQLALGRSNSDVIGTFSHLVAGQVLGRLVFFGDGGQSINPIGAGLKATAYANWSSTVSPTVLTVFTTPTGTQSPVDRWDFRQNGHFVPVGDGLLDIAEPANQLRKIYAMDATFTGNVVYPGPFSGDSTAAAAGLAMGAAYRHTDGTIHHRQT